MNESTSGYLNALIRHFCARRELPTYDPYDIWKTPLGFRVKQLYNRRPRLGLFPAGALALFDDLLNNNVRMFYKRAEYPIVRALAALSLLNLYRKYEDKTLLDWAHWHLQWLLNNSCRGYSGLCWGLGFPHAVTKDLMYDRNVPFSVMTPYALEALVKFSQISQDNHFDSAIASILCFFEEDIQIMQEDEEKLATSYGPFRDRIVINAISYTMYSYALILPYVSMTQKDLVQAKIKKLYAFIRGNQRGDGSWWYSPESGSFVDCFHSCIVLKNIIKSNRIMRLNDAEVVIATGYAYIKHSFLETRAFLFKRFSVRNKPGLVRFDLYDNAEMLNLAILVDDSDLVHRLLASVLKRFCRDLDVYSQIDFIGCLRNKNTLRWAVMPFLYATSQL